MELEEEEEGRGMEDWWRRASLRRGGEKSARRVRDTGWRRGERRTKKKKKRKKKRRRRRGRRSCRTVQENHLTQESETSGACIQENGRVGSGFRLSVTIATSAALWLSKRATGGKSLVRTIILHCCGLPFCNPTLHSILTPSIVALSSRFRPLLLENTHERKCKD